MPVSETANIFLAGNAQICSNHGASRGVRLSLTASHNITSAAILGDWSRGTGQRRAFV